MQHTQLGPAKLALYNDYVQSDHDFTTWVDILTMEELETGQGVLLDGQVNVDSYNRTATCTLSDPENALKFGTSFGEDDDGVLWVNRLLRFNHRVTVPGIGPVTSVPFVGVPTSVGRNGGELGLELADKKSLAMQGVKPFTFPKGYNAAKAIWRIMHDLCGEWNLHVPSARATLSRPYTVGLDGETSSPYRVSQNIATHELGWNIYFKANGMFWCQPKDTQPDRMPVKHLLAPPNMQTSFTDFKNYAKVTSGKTLSAIAELSPKDRLSASSLARHGVPRLMPLVVDDSGLKNQSQANDRASQELRLASGLQTEQSHNLVPFYHLDNGDLLLLPENAGDLPFLSASIPMATGADMSFGRTSWVSSPVVVRRPEPKRR